MVNASNDMRPLSQISPQLWRFRHKSGARPGGKFALGSTDASDVLKVAINPKEDQGFGLDWSLEVDSRRGGRCHVFGFTPQGCFERSVLAADLRLRRADEFGHP